MDNKSIYTALVAAGLSPEGACGLMGNFKAESGMLPNNAQNGLTRLTDEEYTAAANNGTIDFVGDSIGYGLAQWTFWSRKQGLLNAARSRGVSVGDMQLQLDFCMHELKTEYKGVWDKLCGEITVYDAAAVVCTDYERPAHNNIDTRAKFAQEFYTECCTELHGVKAETGGETMCNVNVPMLKSGSTGEYVKTAQYLLKKNGCSCGLVDGKFANKTFAAVKRFQLKKKLAVDGIIGSETWAALLKG